VESMTVQVPLEQLQQFSGILVVDDTEVDLEHRAPRKNSLRAFPDVAGLEPADCTGRLCHVMLECFSVVLRPRKTLESPLFEEPGPLNLILFISLDWIDENGTTSSYHPLIMIFSSGPLIVDMAQTSLQAGFSARGA